MLDLILNDIEKKLSNLNIEELLELEEIIVKLIKKKLKQKESKSNEDWKKDFLSISIWDHLTSEGMPKINKWKIKEMDLNCFISTITVFELYAGAITERHKRDLETAKRSAEIYKELKNNNQLIEFRDIFIGATALETNLPIITLNEEHFKRIKGIKIYDINEISSST